MIRQREYGGTGSALLQDATLVQVKLVWWEGVKWRDRQRATAGCDSCAS
jgi:hypothetical protein